MYTVYVYDNNWLSVAQMTKISEYEVDDIVGKLKTGGFNVNAVKDPE